MYPYINVFGKLIGTYGVCMVIGVMLCAWLSIRRGKTMGVRSEDIIIVITTAVGIGLLCGSLLYIFVTYPMDVIIQMIKSGEITKLQGGIVFYGGLIGGLLGAMLGTKIAKCRFGDILNSVVPFIPLGHAIGRVGCVMAGCCHGKQYDGFLAIHYPRSVLGVSPEQGYFPVQPLESLFNLIIFGTLLLIARKAKRGVTLLGAYLSMYAVARFILEFFRGDESRGIYFGVSLSQWISFGLFAVGALCIIFGAKKKSADV